MDKCFDLKGLFRGGAQVFRDRHPLLRVYFYPRPISPAFRERVMVAVSQRNGCRVCQLIHANWAVLSGNREEELACSPSLSPAELSDTEKEWMASEEMGAVVRLVQYGNDCGNTFHSLCQQIKGSPRSLSAEEWLLFFLLALPVGVAYLAGAFLGVANRVLRGRIQLSICSCGEGSRVSLLRGGREQ